MSEEKIINRVAESGIITLNLEAFFPDEKELAPFDLKAFLFMELMLKEKEFRSSLKQLDLSPFTNKIIAVHCSTDAIIPMWAYMLVSATLKPIAQRVVFGTSAEVSQKLLIENIRTISAEDYRDQRVVIKGCGEKPIPQEAYLEITNILIPVAKSVLFGEPCSTVPVYKRPA